MIYLSRVLLESESPFKCHFVINQWIDSAWINYRRSDRIESKVVAAVRLVLHRWHMPFLLSLSLSSNGVYCLECDHQCSWWFIIGWRDAMRRKCNQPKGDARLSNYALTRQVMTSLCLSWDIYNSQWNESKRATATGSVERDHTHSPNERWGTAELQLIEQ